MYVSKRSYRKLFADLKAARNEASSAEAAREIRALSDARMFDTKVREIADLRVQMTLLHEIRGRDLILSLNTVRSPLPPFEQSRT